MNIDTETSDTEPCDVSPNVMEMIISMKAQMDHTNDILAALMAERTHLPTWVLEENHNPPFQRLASAYEANSVASKNVTSDAAQTASLTAAQTANSQAAQTAPLLAAQAAISQPAQAEPIFESTETLIDPIQRYSDEDILSLYGGKEFDDHPGSNLDADIDNDSFLQVLNESLLPSEDQRPPISEPLAKIVNAKFTTEIDIDKRKEILGKYKIPKNCDSLLVPRVNPEIWAKLPPSSKRGDIRMSSLQDSIARVTGSISGIIDTFLQAREKKCQIDFKTSIAQLLDCTVLLGHGSQEMSFKRRDSLRPHLSYDFKQACSRTLKPGKMLFGDDLPKTIDALKATNKVMHNVISVANASRQGQRSLAPPGYPNSAMYKAYYPSRGGYLNRSKSVLGARGRISSYPPRQAYPPRPQPQHQQHRKFTKS